MKQKPAVLAKNLPYLKAFKLYRELSSNRPDLTFSFKPQGNAGLYQVELER
jgi:hypothetical protein